MKTLSYSILLALLTVSCSKSADVSSPVEASTVNSKTSFKTTDLNIQIEPRISKGLSGDLTDVGFTIQDSPYHPLIKGRMDCSVDSTSRVSCSGEVNLNSLAAKDYRIIVYTNETVGKEAFACDYFDYKKENQLNLTISPSSSGECILAQLKDDTGFSENQIQNRVKHLLNADDVSDDIDVETTLYDLFRYYNQSSKQDWDQAWKLLVEAIKLDKPLPKKHKSMIDAAGRSF